MSIRINTATKGELMTIPGIGHKTAEKIIQVRDRYGGMRKEDCVLFIGPVSSDALSKMLTCIDFTQNPAAKAQTGHPRAIQSTGSIGSVNKTTPVHVPRRTSMGDQATLPTHTTHTPTPLTRTVMLTSTPIGATTGTTTTTTVTCTTTSPASTVLVSGSVSVPTETTATALASTARDEDIHDLLCRLIAASHGIRKDHLQEMISALPDVPQDDYNVFDFNTPNIESYHRQDKEQQHPAYSTTKMKTEPISVVANQDVVKEDTQPTPFHKEIKVKEERQSMPSEHQDCRTKVDSCKSCDHVSSHTRNSRRRSSRDRKSRRKELRSRSSSTKRKDWSVFNKSKTASYQEITKDGEQKDSRSKNGSRSRRSASRSSKSGSRERRQSHSKHRRHRRHSSSSTSGTDTDYYESERSYRRSRRRHHDRRDDCSDHHQACCRGDHYDHKRSKKESRDERGYPKHHPKRLQFDGTTNWLSFKQLFDSYRSVMGWCDSECRDYLIWSLSGKALYFFTITSKMGKKYSFFKIMKKLEDRFGKKELSQISMATFAQALQKPEEQLEDWADRVLVLATAAFRDLPEDYRMQEAITRFCHGSLDEKAGKHAFLQNVKSIQAAMNLVKQYQYASYVADGEKQTSRRHTEDTAIHTVNTPSEARIEQMIKDAIKQMAAKFKLMSSDQ